MKSRMPDFKVEDNNVEFNFSSARFRRQYQTAQNRLDAKVMDDMIPLMPVRTGDFLSRTRAESAAIQGTGRVVAAAAPFGYFLYYGKVMVDEETGSAWARPGAKKVVTDESLDYSRGSARDRWFLEAKHKHYKEWIRIAKNTAGGGE